MSGTRYPKTRALSEEDLARVRRLCRERADAELLIEMLDVGSESGLELLPLGADDA